jgi:hypothetical protein
MKTAIGYFPHDFNSRNDERILELREKHGPAGYAWFFMLCEIMAENDDGSLDIDRAGGYSISMAITKAQLSAFLDDCKALKLLVPGPTPNKLTSQRMQAHKSSREAMARGARNRANRSAKVTASTQEPQTDHQPTRVPILGRKLALLEFPETPRSQIERCKPMELETFKIQFNADILKAGSSWEEILDKWETSLMSTNDEYPIDDNQRHKQLIATLRRYILSWISNSRKGTKPTTENTEKHLAG